MSSNHIMVMFLSIGILLGLASVLGEVARRVRQPAVVGEILAGIILGPTVFGAVSPALFSIVFPMTGINAVVLDAIANLAIVMFLLVAGMEADLSIIWRQGSLGLKVGIGAMVVPFVLAFSATWLAPGFFDRGPETDPVVFSLFLATVLSVCGVSIIARILMDLDLYRSDVGMVVLSAAIFNDLVGWVVFAVLIGMMKGTGLYAGHIAATIATTLAFIGGMLTVGRRLVHGILPVLQAYTRFPGGVLSFSLILALLCASLTAWLGVHGILGSFIAGVIIGDSSHLRENTRVIIGQFVSFIFAPLFFASIGLRIDFLSNFDPLLVLAVFLLAVSGKAGGALLGARWGKMFFRDAWAAAAAINSRGAMAVVLGLVALKAGVITSKIFVALVAVSIATSMISGPAIRIILKRVRRRRFMDMVEPKTFFRDLKSVSRKDAIAELTEKVCQAYGLDAAEVEEAVWMREKTMPTGIGNGVALPHARIKGLRDALVAVGISMTGIDFDAPDDKPAHVICLILTPLEDEGQQLVIASEIARLFRDRKIVDGILKTKTYNDFMALLKNEASSPDRKS